MNTFFNCMNAGGVAGGYCQGLCSAQIDILESNCLDTVSDRATNPPSKRASDGAA